MKICSAKFLLSLVELVKLSDRTGSIQLNSTTKPGFMTLAQLIKAGAQGWSVFPALVVASAFTITCSTNQINQTRKATVAFYRQQIALLSGRFT